MASTSASATILRLPSPPDLMASEDEIWAYLEIGVDHIMTRAAGMGIPFTPATYTDLYTVIYNYCTGARRMGTASRKRHGADLLGEELYVRLAKYFRLHFETIKENLQAASGSLQDEDFLEVYASEWDRCLTGARYLNGLFAFLNRMWIKRERDEKRTHVYPVYTLALSQWRNHLFIPLQNDNSKLSGTVFRLIERERNGGVVDQDLLKKVIDSFVSLGIDNENPDAVCLETYTEHIETPLVDASEEYYRLESEAFLSEHTVSEYLRKVDERLQQEDNRVARYLREETRATLLPACEHVLIREKEELLWENFAKLIDSDQDEDLRRMHGLLARIPESVEPMRRRFEGHVKWDGLSSTTTVGEGRRDVEDSDHDASLDSMVKDFVDL